MRTKQTEKKGNFEMIYIGVDFGDARVGLAKSDPAGILAGAVGTLKVRGLADAAEQTAEAVARLGGTAVVVGLPRNMDGTEGPRAELYRDFAARRLSPKRPAPRLCSSTNAFPPWRPIPI